MAFVLWTITIFAVVVIFTAARIVGWDELRRKYEEIRTDLTERWFGK